MGFVLKSKIAVLRKAASRTIITLRVLVATSIVPRSLSGISDNLITVSDLFVFFNRMLSVSSVLKEKYATSEAEMIAEANKRMRRKMNPAIILISGGLVVIPDRSKEYVSAYPGSNWITFDNTI
jgi:hypothetical protein